MTAPTAGVPRPAPPAERPVETVRAGMWNRAPGWILITATVLGGLGLVWSGTYPHGSVLALIVAAWWSLGCAVIWFARLVSFAATRPQHRGERWWPFLVPPAIGIATIAIGVTGLPLQARWSLSEGAFDARADALVARVERGDADPGDNLIREDRVALYTVDFAHVDGEGNVFFSIAGSGFIDSGGFARLPDGPPDEPFGRDEYEHLGGDWYLWLEPF